MAKPRMIVTGASGFVGRNLVPALVDRYEIEALARRHSALEGTIAAPAIRWHYVDIGEPVELRAVFSAIRDGGPVDVLIHLAGHYDFTGDNVPEYRRTNVDGTRHVLDAAQEIGVRDVVFASSVAACGFPPPERPLDEASPPDGDNPYAASKKAGEEMLPAYAGSFRAWIVRFAALFSDWCEYEPLYRFCEIWLSRNTRRRVLAGRGLSAVPYLHVRDAVSFVLTLLARRDDLDPGAILIASPDGATSHRELFEGATAAHFGARDTPILVPRPVCRAGLELQEAARRSLGLEIFERPWMGRYIDLQLSVDAGRTRERLGWAPRPRLAILRRMPFLVQNRKAFPAEWQRRNHAVLKSVRLRENLRIGRLLRDRVDELSGALARHVCEDSRAHRFPNLRAMDGLRIRADGPILVEALVDSVRTGEKALFTGACRELSARRRDEGIPVEELSAALDALNDLCVLSLAGEGSEGEWSLSLYDHVTMTVQFGADEVFDVYEGAP